MTDPGGVFRDLLYRALSREEEEIRAFGCPPEPPEHFLSSVAFAPELAIGYLLRKQARRDGIRVEGERHYEGEARCVDLCLIEEGVATASLEIKGPWGVWESKARLLEDVAKRFNRTCRIHGVEASAARHNAWILVESVERRPQDVERFVRETLRNFVTIEECLMAPPIPLNRGAVGVLHVGRHDYRDLWVVVFRGELR